MGDNGTYLLSNNTQRKSVLDMQASVLARYRKTGKWNFILPYTPEEKRKFFPTDENGKPYYNLGVYTDGVLKTSMLLKRRPENFGISPLQAPTELLKAVNPCMISHWLASPFKTHNDLRRSVKVFQDSGHIAQAEGHDWLFAKIHPNNCVTRHVIQKSFPTIKVLGECQSEIRGDKDIRLVYGLPLVGLDIYANTDSRDKLPDARGLCHISEAVHLYN